MCLLVIIIPRQRHGFNMSADAAPFEHRGTGAKKARDDGDIAAKCVKNEKRGFQKAGTRVMADS